MNNIEPFSQSELRILDKLTPTFISYMSHTFSAAERRILTTIAGQNKRVRVKDLAGILRMQQNLLSARLHRLSFIKGVLNRTEEGYFFTDLILVRWLIARKLGCSIHNYIEN